MSDTTELYQQMTMRQTEDTLNQAMFATQRRYKLNLYDAEGQIVGRQLRGILWLTRRLGLHGEAAVAFARLSIVEQRQHIATLHRLYSKYDAELAQHMADDDICPKVPGGYCDPDKFDAGEYYADERMLREALPDMFA